jgi:hypothetical protein
MAQKVKNAGFECLLWVDAVDKGVESGAEQ